MIQIQRIDCPPSLDPAFPNGAGPSELRRAQEKLAQGGILKGGDFTAYRDAAVRERLREMFYGKCAYCESKIAGSQDTDVEHYRPKGGVTEAEEAGLIHPGYWWLAMKWENLVLSCQHCNQSRTYQVIIPDNLETEEEVLAFLVDPPQTTVGKKNAFPTEDNRWVTSPTGNLTTEKPLILNPVDMNPEEHIEWVLFKGASTVRAKNASSIGESTRNILGLNRRWLEEERRILLREMRIIRDNIIFAINGYLEANTPAEQAAWETLANSSIEQLVGKASETSCFAGLARAFLAHVRAEVDEMQKPPSD